MDATIPFSLEALKANPHLHVKTKSGTPVELFDRQIRADQPLVGILLNREEDGWEEEVELWHLDGSFSYDHKPCSLDLVLALF